MNKHCLPWIAGLLAMFLSQTQFPAAGAHVLANEKIRVTISEAGRLEAVENPLASETYSFKSDAFALDTDLGLFSNSKIRPTRITAGKQRIVYHFELSSGGTPGASSISADLIYTMQGNHGFFRRALRITSRTPLRVKNLTLGKTAFARPPDEVVHYVTFIAAPTVEFIRNPFSVEKMKVTSPGSTCPDGTIIYRSDTCLGVARRAKTDEREDPPQLRDISAKGGSACGGSVTIRQLDAWKMSPSNPW